MLKCQTRYGNEEQLFMREDLPGVESCGGVGGDEKKG